MILADDEGKQHLAHRYKSTNTDAIILLYQYKKYKYRFNWRDFFCFTSTTVQILTQAASCTTRQVAGPCRAWKSVTV